MSKLRHIAVIVEDPEASAKFFEEAFDMKRAGTARVLLIVIRENPRVVLQAVRKARMRDPASLPVIEPLRSYRAPPGFGNRPPPLRRRRR